MPEYLVGRERKKPLINFMGLDSMVNWPCTDENQDIDPFANMCSYLYNSYNSMKGSRKLYIVRYSDH